MYREFLYGLGRDREALCSVSQYTPHRPQRPTVHLLTADSEPSVPPAEGLGHFLLAWASCGFFPFPQLSRPSHKDFNKELHRTVGVGKDL